jgi:hypothetical protein
MKKKKLTLRAYIDTDDPGQEERLNKMAEICRFNGLGSRTSYDMFEFNSENDITIFLLKSL